MLAQLKFKTILWAKKLVYFGRGEPYAIGGATLRFLPGTRPIKTKYRNAVNDDVARYEALQLELFVALLGPGDFALDVGAHAGQNSLVMAACCSPEGRVVAFEPDHFARARLEANLELNPQIQHLTIESLAVSDKAGTATLFSRGGDANSSLSAGSMASTAIDQFERLEVTLCTIDDYLSERGLPAPRLVKIDTEGAEIRILQGAPQLLASDATILCELHPYAWESFGNSAAELETVLAKAGLTMRYLDQTQPVTGELHYGIVILERADAG